nr:HD-GYP domain-containing protein [Deinococcus aestuarii]
MTADPVGGSGLSALLGGWSAACRALHAAGPEDLPGLLADYATRLLGASRAAFVSPARSEPVLWGEPGAFTLACRALETGEVQGLSPGGGEVLLAAPLLDSAEGPLGAVVVARGANRPFGERDVHLLTALSTAGAAALGRARAVQAAQDRAEEFRMLAELSGATLSLTEPAAVAQASLEACRAFLGADHAAYYAPARQVGAEVGEAPGPYRAVLSAQRERRAAGMSSRARRGVQATHAYPQEPDARPELIAAGVRGVVVAPVVLAGGEVEGVVNLVWFRDLPALPRAARALAGRAAELIARAVERESHLRAVEATREGGLLALGLALEARDLETSGHTRRVVALATRLGEVLGLRGDLLEELRQGAYLHDLGKLTVPDAVLLKPGKLTAEEWITMRGHAARGYELARQMPTLGTETLHVVRHHHERWDGAGYPDGMAGEEIPLGARIFAVVDVYDALTSERPYKRAWTPGEALRELHAQAGQHFDPQVVEAFFSLLPGTRLVERADSVAGSGGQEGRA